MASVERTGRRRKSRAKRPHNPELLRCKRAARALGIPWGAVTAERDRLRRVELEEREQADSLHRAAAVYFGGKGAAPFWRGFFRRKFAKLIAEGGDYTSVPGFDLFVAGYYRSKGLTSRSPHSTCNATRPSRLSDSTPARATTLAGSRLQWAAPSENG